MQTDYGYYIFRMPGDETITAGCGPIERGIRAGGFVISPFDTETLPILTISSDTKVSLDKFPFDELGNLEIHLYESTSRRDHENAVRMIISQLHAGEKCVLSRYISDYSKKISLRDSFHSLCKAFPQGMVYCFYTPESGCWLGASPELLLRRKEDMMSTMALAGTRPASASSDSWDEKNIEEQEIVTRFITGILKKHCEEVKVCNPLSTHQAGSVEHLRTDITAKFIREGKNISLKSLLDELAPTPALCGYPKQKAHNLINAVESTPREYYGGFFGPFRKDGNFDFYVLLRSLKLGKEGWAMYVGGGITPMSDPHEEYKETERKADSILKFVSFI